jgi:hypothetical protein
MGTKHYPVRMFSDGMDNFVMDERTLKTTPRVAGLAKDDFYKGIQKLYDRANLCVQLEGMYVRKLNNKSVISFTQILFIMPVLKLSRRLITYLLHGAESFLRS